MKSKEQWFAEYAESHQNETNQFIHFICVPAIFFSIVGLLMCIPNKIISNIVNLNNPLIENWAVIIFVFIHIFYLRMSFITFARMFIFSIICVLGNYYLGTILPLFYVSFVIFVIAWIGQFYGHKLEGAKPSFFKDLQFLLIGPAWILGFILRRLGIRY